MDDYLKRVIRHMGNLIRHKGKAQGLSEAHRLQRHEDGSYTITIRLVPEGVDMDASGVDGVVISQSQRFRGFDR